MIVGEHPDFNISLVIVTGILAVNHVKLLTSRERWPSDVPDLSRIDGFIKKSRQRCWPARLFCASEP
jgi:hypothetical protein